MKIHSVPQHAVNQIWPKVEGFLASALDHSHGEYNAEHAKVYLCTGAWQLLVAVDDANEVHGAAAVEYMNRPNDRVAFIIAIGGRLITNRDTFSQMTAILKSCGATKIEGAARESIARLWSRYGFTEKYRIVEVSL